MAVLNVAPDSFYFHGDRCVEPDKACDKALRLIDEGADLIDIGGESTRPGASPVMLEEELQRVLPVVKAIRKHSDIPLSLDTTKAEVARQALNEGANMVNDVSAGLFDSKMLEVVASHRVPICLNHLPSSSFETMHVQRTYGDLLGEISSFFEDALKRCHQVGISSDNILLDPGIGFGGKSPQENVHILTQLHRFRSFQCPLLIGTSRKSFIGHLLDLPMEERLEATLATYSIARRHGATIFRAHDVAPTRRYLDMLDLLITEEGEEQKI